MASRVKTARKAAAAVSYVDPPEFDAIAASSDEDEDEEDWDEEGQGRKRRGKVKAKGAPAKKRKTTTTAAGKSKGKKGGQPKVDHLRTLPMDLLVEIFSYLLPLELLQLSGTSKAYRGLLCSKRSQSIWRTSRRLVKLPDLEADDLSEMSYAQLIFGNTCDACAVKCTRQPDYFLRIRICKDCRKDSFVKLNKRFTKDFPQYHPSVIEVVNTTSHSPSRDYYTRTAVYTLKSELEYYSKKLWVLQEDDDNDADSSSTGVLKSAPKTRSGRTSSRAPAFSYEEVDEAEEQEHTPGLRVKSFIEQRKEALKVVKKDAEMLMDNCDAARQAAKADDHAWWQVRRRLKNPSQDRSAALRDKVVSSIPGARWWDTYDKLWEKSPLVNSAEPLTDQEWIMIKPAVEDLLDTIHQAHKEASDKALKNRDWYVLAEKREKHVLERLKVLRDDETDDFARAAFPLNADLLLFESVKLALLPDKVGNVEDYKIKLSDEEWEEALEGIKEEIDTYRTDLFLHAVKLILSATTEGELPGDDDILDNIDEFDDDFFARATSLLVCDLPDCRRSAYTRYDWTAAPPHRWGPRSQVQVPARFTRVASLLPLLKHQHSKHADFTYKSKKAKRLGPRFHIALPTEVACAISALIEVGELDGETAGVEELDEMDDRGGGSRYGWENSHNGKKRFDSWKELIDAVFSESQRYANMNPPKSLDPPCIVYTASGYRRLGIEG